MREDGIEQADRAPATSSLGGKRATSRRFRRVPPAVTPLTPSDIAAGVAGQLRGAGRDEFRTEVETLLDAESTATYTSYRRALGACLDALGEQYDGDTVVLPAFCSSDFDKTVDGLGLSVRRYDVDAATFAADLDSLGVAMRPDVRAVVAVNVLGYTSEMDELAEVCDRGDVALVEALGYALGASYGGEKLGTFGDCAVCNFQQGKPIPVGGGMIVSQDPSLQVGDAGRPVVGPTLGTLSGYAAFGRPRLYGLYRRAATAVSAYRDGGSRVTTHPESKAEFDVTPPLPTMSDFQGAVASRVFARQERDRRERARTAAYYADAFRNCEKLDLVEPLDGLSNHQYVRFPLVASSEALRDHICERLADAGIGSSTLYEWPPIDGDQFPEAARLKRRTLTLPTHPYVDDRDRRTAVETVVESLP